MTTAATRNSRVEAPAEVLSAPQTRIVLRRGRAGSRTRVGGGYECDLYREGVVEALYPQHPAHCRRAFVPAARAFESVQFSRALARRRAQRSPDSCGVPRNRRRSVVD